MPTLPPPFVDCNAKPIQCVSNASPIIPPHVQCPVCNRFGIHIDSFAVTSSRAQCTHCGVNTCAVCSMLYPLSCEKDDLVHAECQEKFMSLRLAQAFEKRLNFVAQRRCPQCGNAGTGCVEERKGGGV